MKRIYYFGAGIALGAVATRRTRRAKEAAREALKASLTPSAIAADVADAIAELGNAIGAFASDVRQGAINRRTTYRPLIDNATGAVVMVGPELAGPVDEDVLPPIEQRAPGGLPPRRNPAPQEPRKSSTATRRRSA